MSLQEHFGGRMGTFGAPTVEDIKALGAQLQQTDKETKK